MLRHLAELAYRRPRALLGAAVVVLIVAASFGISTPKHLSSSDNDFQDKRSESYRVEQLVTRATGVVPGPAISTVVTSEAEARTAADRLRADPAVALVTTTRSPDGAILVVSGSLRQYADAGTVARRLEHALPGLVGGAAVASEQVRAQSERDLFRAELIALPLLTLLGLWVFRSLVAALLPVAAGILSIATTLALLRVANFAVPISIFALNLVTGAGLGLAIDYSLLLVSRYREELDRSGPGLEALQRTVATAGRTVAFSAITVATAFASLLVFPLAFLRSMAIGGMIVAPFAGLVALTVVPALFAVLGRRINALAIRSVEQDREGGWYRFAQGVMRHPLPIAIASASLLIVLGLPFLHVRFTAVTSSVLPASASARQADDAIRAHFPAGSVAPLEVIAAPGARDVVERMPGVASIGASTPLADGRVAFAVVPHEDAMSNAAKTLVRSIRGLPGTQVGGLTAWYLDTSRTLKDNLAFAFAVLAAAVLVLLFLVTRSFVLPVKAILMNVLSLCAAFGIVVWIFQDGRLESVLRYRSEGALEITQPVLLFAIAFGLATDYGVFLLARIREGHDDGLENREAVALGLERTGRVVTAAALLFCVAVGSFATSSIVLVKVMGVGIALAVAIDASLVRALLVPSLMALLGDWNWWAPRRFRR